MLDSQGVCVQLPVGVVRDDVSETKKAGVMGSRSAISHARELHTHPVHPGATHDHATANPVHPGGDTHTNTHTDDATHCDCVTCNGCRWLHEPEARRQGADAGSDEGARGGVRGRMVVS